MLSAQALAMDATRAMSTARLCAVIVTCGLVGGAGCSDPEDSNATGPDAGMTSPDAFVPQWAFASVHGVANLDDDDGNTIDWQQPPFAADDDYARLVLPATS